MATKSTHKMLKKATWWAFIDNPVFAKYYGWFSVGLLLVSVVFWSIKSAVLQQSNADQLVNPYLLENSRTFHAAVLPGAHTFLLKWPLFWLIKLFGYSHTAFITTTLLVVLATLAGLVWVIYRIERRPLIFGTLCLALASTLLLVPAEAYAGALLPVNMAMLASRNLEYIIYVVCLIVLIKLAKVKSTGFWVAVVLLSLLIASDKLFLSLSVVGALLVMLAYSLRHGWKLTTLAAHWLLASVLAALGAIVILWGLQASRLVHISSQSVAGPFGFIHNIHDLVIGFIYAVMSILTNFGANPAYDATVVKNIPHELASRLFSLGGPAYLINATLLLAGLFMSWQVVWPSLKHHKSETKLNKMDNNTILAIMLLASTLAALMAFMFTDHYFAVDGRYLTITLFAVFIAAAVFLSKRTWQPNIVVSVGAILTVSIILGVIGANKTYTSSRQALYNVTHRNSLIAQVVAHSHTKILVGDYWRVLPVKNIVGDSLTVTPLDSCVHPRGALNSQAWQPDLSKQGFVYLLSFDHSLTNYPSCSLKQIISAYGRPNSSTLIAGTLSNPQELMLFYDLGINKSSPNTKILAQGPSTVVPVSLTQLIDLLPELQCNTPTIMTIVAHQDDDLLFMNPDLLHAIHAGYCVRTVYVTAGDAGNGEFYWLSREKGSEAAYSTMTAENDNLWVKRLVRLPNNEFVTVASPRGNPRIALVFMHLPDGNLNGQGFKATNDESLVKLEAGKTKVIHAVDGQSSYSSSQLTESLITFMRFFQPTEIHTQANFNSTVYPDHSDHMAVGRFVKLAYKAYEDRQLGNIVTIPIKYYVGYPVHQMKPNVSGSDLQAGNAAYFAYAKYDQGACKTQLECNNASTFGIYLQRQYQNPY